MPDSRSDQLVARKATAKAAGPSAAGAMTFFVMIVATLYFGKDVLMPITLALLLAFVLAPVVNLLRHIHLGRVPSVLLGVTLALGVILAIGGVIGSQIATLSQDIPQYASTVETKVTNVRNYTIGRLSQLADKVGRQKEKPGTPTGAPAPASSQPSAAGAATPTQDIGSTPLELAERYLSTVLSPFATFGIVFIVAVFALLQKEDLRDRLIRLVGPDDLHHTTRAIDDGAHRLSRYFLTQLIINSAFGVIVGAGLLIIGLPNPVLWGILSALLRFVPYVGSLISAVLPMALAAAVAPGWSMLLWTAGLYLVVEGVTGQVIEPLVYGNSTGLSPFSVVVAAIFWSWLWGPVGLILSTPLTLCLVVVGRNAKRLEFLDIMLGDRPPLTPVETLYQRILAGDPDEAQHNAELILKERSLGIYYDAVAIKAMQLALSDAERGAIDSDQLERVDHTMKALILGLQSYEDDPPAPAAPKSTTLQSPFDTPDVPPQLDPDSIPPSTSGLSAAAIDAFATVLCIAGRGPLDEAASAILVQLLGKHGITGKLIAYGEVSRDKIGLLDVHDATTVCITGLDISSSPAHLRYLIQRLRGRLPADTQIIVGIDPGEDAALRDEAARTAIGADLLTHSLVETVAKCVEFAIKRADLEGALASPRPAVLEAGRFR